MEAILNFIKAHWQEIVVFATGSTVVGAPSIYYLLRFLIGKIEKRRLAAQSALEKRQTACLVLGMQLLSKKQTALFQGMQLLAYATGSETLKTRFEEPKKVITDVDIEFQTLMTDMISMVKTGEAAETTALTPVLDGINSLKEITQNIVEGVKVIKGTDHVDTNQTLI